MSENGGKDTATSPAAAAAAQSPDQSRSPAPSPALGNAAMSSVAATGMVSNPVSTLLAALGNAARARAAIGTLTSVPGTTPPAPTTIPDPPVPGINKVGFIDNDDGSNIRTGPAESGGQKVREEPLPPATRVFVGGTHPEAAGWWYVTAQTGEGLLRGYVQGLRVTTDLPEPTAKLYQLRSGDTAERLAVQEFSTAVGDGHDLRYYENVLLFVNKLKGRAGVKGSYQDPGLFGYGADNVQLIAGHRIWLVSPAYARALEDVVPSGSLTGGALAKVKRIAGHIEDIILSAVQSPKYLDEVAGEYAKAIGEHIVEIVGIVAAFVAAEALSAFLAATPTCVGQLAAIVIQLGLAAFGATGLVSAGIEAVKHASEWLTMAWTASGNEVKLAAASKEFLKMLVSIAMAALAYIGIRGNVAGATKIFSSLPPPPTALAFAGAGGVEASAGWVANPVALPMPGPAGPFGNASMMVKVDDETAGSTEASKSEKPKTSAPRTNPEERTPAPALKDDPWNPAQVEQRQAAAQEHYAKQDLTTKPVVKPGQMVPAPRDLPAFPDAQRVTAKTPVQGGGGVRARWKSQDGTIYEWDSQHGRVEKYSANGSHLGEFDPKTGMQTKPPNSNRSVKP
jgi:hypothetical protein